MRTASPLRIRILALSLLVTSGCKSDDGPTGPLVTDGGVTAAGKATCKDTAPLYCRKFFECERVSAEDTYGTLESCIIADAADCEDLALTPDVRKAITDWAACNRALGALTCDQWMFGGPLEACRHSPGARTVGAACSGGLQCASQHCQWEADANGSFPDCGQCTEPPKAGEACGDGNGCEWGVRCAEKPSGERICVKIVGEGAACQEDADPCQGALVCVQGSCARPVAAGGVCSASYQCKDDLRCVNGSCGDPVGEGGACSDVDPVCAKGLGCVNGACTPGKPAGAPCTLHEECLSNVCDNFNNPGTTNTCFPPDEPRVGVGETCEPRVGAISMGPECEYKAYCDSDSKTCALRKPNGKPCASDDECLGWLVCTAGKCDDPEIPMCGP